MTMHSTMHCIALHCTASHRMTLHCIALHRIASHDIALHCIALHCIASHDIALHCITLHYMSYITLHCIAFHYISLHYRVTSLSLFGHFSVTCTNNTVSACCVLCLRAQTYYQNTTQQPSVEKHCHTVCLMYFCSTQQPSVEKHCHTV